VIPISVRADFEDNGTLIPLHYCHDGIYVRIDRIISVKTDGMTVVFSCRCKDTIKRILFSQFKWYLVVTE